MYAKRDQTQVFNPNNHTFFEIICVEADGIFNHGIYQVWNKIIFNILFCLKAIPNAS